MKKSSASYSYDQQTVIGIIFSNKQKHVLLIKRRDVPVWVLPGGGVEKKESLEEACIREVLEETGFHVKILRKVGKYIPINRLARLTHLFECEIVKGNPTLGLETKAIHFFSCKKLPKLIPPPYDEWITDGLQKTKKPLEKRLLRVQYKTLFFHFFRHPILVLRFVLSKIGLTINT